LIILAIGLAILALALALGFLRVGDFFAGFGGFGGFAVLAIFAGIAAPYSKLDNLRYNSKRGI
jgi:hypothetical protein